MISNKSLQDCTILDEQGVPRIMAVARLFKGKVDFDFGIYF